MKNKIIIIVFLFSILACNSTKDKNAVKNISLIELIANPNKYHNQKVSVQGYFTNEFEGRAIYVSKNDYLTGIMKNGVALYIGNNGMEKFKIDLPHRGYVTIVGIYNKNKKGSYNFFSGGFEEVISIQRMYKRDGINDEFNME